MPYIKQEDRVKFDGLLDEVRSRTINASAGELNYFISSLIWSIFENNKSYSKANELIGVLECVKQEFYRRQLSPYEDQCIDKNGDLNV